MIKNYLKLKGIIDTEIKQKGDKYYFTLNTSINNNESAKSLIYVELTKNMFEPIKDNYKDIPATIYGSVQAKKTKNEVPFIYLKCDNIHLQQENGKDVSARPKKEKKYKQQMKKQNKEKIKPWNYNLSDEDFTLIDTSKVYLIEEEHQKANVSFNSCEYDENNPIGVRQLEDGNFALVIGFREYAFAKLLNKPTIKAYITELHSKEFKEKYFNKN